MAIELAAVCQTHGVDLAVDTPEKPTLCQIDETLFGQAITNLIMNALAHGGTEVSRIEISVTTKDAAIQIEVQNNGRVLDDKGFDVALARFSQVSPAVGTGLGLPIAQAITDGASGSLTCGSRLRGCVCGWRFQGCSRARRH